MNLATVRTETSARMRQTCTLGKVLTRELRLTITSESAGMTR
jgi:hypothetical protein